LYFDESGIDSRLQEEYGYAPCGEKVYAEKSGKREVKTTILACYQYHEKELIQPFSFEGSTDSKIVEFYFEQLVFPNIRTGTTIILDNAAIHRPAPLQEIAKKFGCQFIFLPPYSPDLNPIEKCWANLKKSVKKIKRKTTDTISNILKLVFNGLC
jgi:isfu1 transposase